MITHYDKNCLCPTCSFNKAMENRERLEKQLREEYANDPRPAPGLSPSDSSHESKTSPYRTVAAGIASLVEEKQAAYGDSFGKSGAVLAVLYPNGISLPQLDDALTIVRILDKLFRIATDKDALGESPYRDIAGYALLAVVKEANKKGKS